MIFYKTIPSKSTYFIVTNFCLGIIFALSFEPFKVPFLSLFVIGIFFLINEIVSKKFFHIKSIFLYNGISFGFGFFLLSMYWISNSLVEFDSNLIYLLPLPLIFLPLLLSMFFGLMQIINSYYWNDSNSKLFFFPACWTIFEFLRSFLFTGLPWNLISYSWSWSLKYSQIVSILGVYGLGLLTVFCSVSIFSIFINCKNRVYFFISIFILISFYIYGHIRVLNYNLEYLENKIRIIHTYVSQDQKWLNESINHIASLGSNEGMNIFPESSFGVSSNWPENWLIGYIKKENKRYFNSISYNGSTYDKKILVPFGEYIPFSSILSTFFSENTFVKNSLTKGSDNQIFEENITPLICYEVIFPSFVRNSISENTDLLVNISNDAWFGEFSGPKQHFVHALFRSIELGIPMARSSNKGFSGLISPIGEIIHVTNEKKLTFADLKIPKKLESTLYRSYGNLFTYFLIVLFFIIGYAVTISNNHNLK